MNRMLRRLSLVGALASGVALAQSTPPAPATSGPSTGNENALAPRPSMENDKPATGSMGNENDTTRLPPAKPDDALNTGTGGSGDVGTGSPSKKSKAKKQHKQTTGTPGTDTSTNGNAK